MAQDIIKNIPLALDINAQKRLNGTVDIQLYSKDITTGQFEFSFIDEDNKSVVLDESYSAQALVKFEGDTKTYLDDMVVEGSIIRFIFPHDFITRDGIVTMYIYITKGNYTSDVAAISFPVFLSEIDKELDPSVAVHYIGKIEKLIQDMKDEMSSYQVDVDEIVAGYEESISKLQALETNYEPQLTSFTVQLAHKVGSGKKAELEDLSADVLGAIDGSGGPFELTSIPQDNSVTLDKILNPDLLTGYVVSETLQGLPFSGEGNYSVELAEKGNIISTNGNMIDLFGLTNGTYENNGIIVVINGNEISVTGTATANSYFKLSEGSGFVPNNIDLGKPLDNLPQMDSFFWSLYEKTNTGEGFSVSIRSTVSGNYQGISTSEIGSFDNMNETSQVGQIYLFTASGQTVDVNFKLAFGYGLREAVKEIIPHTLLVNDVKKARIASAGVMLSNKSGTIRPLIKLTDMITPSETKVSGVYVESYTDFFYFYKKGSNNDSDKWLRYRFEHWDGEAINNGKGWVLGVVDAVEKVGSSFTVLYPVVKAGEWEMAIRLNGRPDFIGCKQHGSEINFYEKFYIDGTEWTPNNSSFWCDEIKVIEKSTMYDPLDEVTVVGNHTKDYKITVDSIKLRQLIKWTTTQIMGNNDVYTAMLPMIRGNDTTTPHQITSKAYDDATYEEIDVSNASHGARTGRHEPDKWTLYSNSTGISASIESKNKEKLAGAHSFIQNSAGYNKVYFNYCEPEHVVAIGDVWENEITYKLNINL